MQIVLRLTNYYDLQNSIHDCFPTKRHLLAIFFDATWWYKILQTILNLDFYGELSNFIRNFLTNRKFNIRLRRHLSNIHELPNTLQGSVLPEQPTLFNLFINDIINEMSPPVKCSLFANDFRIFFMLWRHTRPIYLEIKCTIHRTK